MENFYELNVRKNNELKFNCVGKFNDINDYHDEIYSKYNFEEESKVHFIFSETRLNNLKNNIINNISNINEYNIIYYGFLFDGTFEQIGVFDDNLDFEDYFFGTQDAYENYIFYGNPNEMNIIIELINKTIEMNNISNEEILAYFDSNITNLEVK